MPVVSSIFLVAALVLAVVIGPQTRPWTWGPSMLALGVSVLAALPAVWRRERNPADSGLLALAALTTGWFAWRAWISPVAELGQADLLLLGAAVAAFVSARAIAGNETAARILSWGIALLLAANLVVIGKQIADPSFSPVFRSRASGDMISGFFAHYNEAANYLIVSSMLVAAAALCGRHATFTRVCWMLIAAAGLAGVWFTRSRGGIFGAAVACGVFSVVLLIIGKRSGAKWFAPVLVAIPVIGFGIGAFLLMGWHEAQQTRVAGSGVDELLDNTCRLYFLGIAMSCVASHPLAGGGSRSFSWECFKFWDNDTQGIGSARPEMVHNELIQSATDYGLVGAGLLVGLLVAAVLAALLRVMFEENRQAGDAADAWRLGALAGLAGMLVQSCFSFVFHLLPGVLFLGICLAQASRPTPRSTGRHTIGSGLILTLAAVVSALWLLPAAWKGTRVTRLLWPTHFGKQAVDSPEARISALSAAIGIWPQSELHASRAAVFQTLAGAAEDPDFQQAAELAIHDYQQAAQLHPFDPVFVINRANLLSQLRREAEAEDGYAKAIGLQGGMETAFRGHFSLANHLFQKGTRLYQSGELDAALGALEGAANHIEEAVAQTPPWVINADGRNLRISIHESLGVAREAAGDTAAARQSYDFAATIPTGARAHYRAGVMIGKIALEEWTQRRPAEAMKHFLEARKRVAQAAGNLPYGITPSHSLEFTRYLDQQIALLKAAKVEPAE